MWPVVNVTRRSIEETGTTVLQPMDAGHEPQMAALAPQSQYGTAMIFTMFDRRRLDAT